MVFSKLFKGRDAAAAPAEEPAAVEPDDAEPETREGAPEQWDELSWAERAARVMPTGASTGSKRPDALFGEWHDGEAIGATHFVRAEGCHIETTGGDTLVDCTMGLGSVAFGYADERVTTAVMHAAGNGNVGGLSSVLEVEVAERFCDLVPCAERVQFLKTGAEAVAAAVRIARTYTGKDVVIGCGYFGWSDWCSTAAGVPAAVAKDYKPVPFDDVGALERAAAEAGDKLAAIVLEPVIERLPSKAWIEKARALCDARGAVLVFDEMKTGFRLATGGYQQFAEITPDLATFGKAIANGFPLAAVCGRADVMDALKKTWISSTLAGEATALAAAFVVLETHRETDVCAALHRIGKATRDIVALALKSSGLGGVSIEGIDPMWLMRFDTPEKEARFLRAAVRHGVLFKRGAYNYAALAHDDAIQAIEAGASNAFVEVQRALASE